MNMTGKQISLRSYLIRCGTLALAAGLLTLIAGCSGDLAIVDDKARLQSVTKSFTSALVGIALREGCISSVDQEMMDFFPELADRGQEIAVVDPFDLVIVITADPQFSDHGGGSWGHEKAHLNLAADFIGALQKNRY